jgi:Flp pilus assembly protein TadG
MMNPWTGCYPRGLRRRLWRDAGQSMVELALCMPLFVLLILGTAEIANVAWSAIQVQNAARAGAQFGSQSRAAAADGTDIATAAKNDAPALGSMIVTSSSGCQCIDTASGNAAGTGCATLTQCPWPYMITAQVLVNTSAVVTPLIRYPGLPASFTLKGRAVMGVAK